MTDSFHIATGSKKGSHKQRNGDAHSFFRFGPGQAYLGAMLADGVGSTSTDWLASSTACEHFKEIGEGLTTSIEDPEQWLTNTVKELDKALEQAPQLLLCAASAVVWEIGSDRAKRRNQFPPRPRLSFKSVLPHPTEQNRSPHTADAQRRLEQPATACTTANDAATALLQKPVILE